MTRFRTRRQCAFTIIELLVVVACILCLVALCLPIIQRRAHSRSTRITCVSNLKQTGLAFKTWALDNNDHFPMHLSTNAGGTLEWGASAVWPHLQVMSNELSTPRVLVCDQDRQRTAATNFNAPAFSDARLSYFIGLGATELEGIVSIPIDPGRPPECSPNSILAGDDNLTNALPAGGRVVPLATNASVGWDRTRHSHKGNLLFTDGSVQEIANGGLRLSFEALGTGTNRLVLPSPPPARAR